MDLSAKIGQLFMIGFDGPELSDPLRRLIKKYPFGGIILFSRNYSDKNQVIELLSNLRDFNATAHPSSPSLFVGVDQEGGRVRRLGFPFTESPPNESWGRTNNPEKTTENARNVARELNEVGININFAPVLDINTNPKNPVIGDRAYGSDPDLVSIHGSAAIKGFWEGGVYPVGKHFPGHGHTSLDSHIALPEVETTLEQMGKLELVPFARCMDNGLEMIMTAHVLYKEIDPEYPATFSRRIISGILRRDMGFDGVVFSDDMEMGAVSKGYDFPEACLLAVEAGVDILLICHDPEKQAVGFRTVYNAVKDGRLSEERINESVARILRLKGKI